MDREVWAFQNNFIPEKYCVGLLAESWERPDPQTVIVHLRKGIHWQDKAPVNGREFTAYDVEFHYDRMLGTGSGYTTPAPMYVMIGMTANWEKVNATDKYTVVFKFKEPTGVGFLTISDTFALNTLEAPELAKQEGALSDWENAVGTGPWILTDFVSDSSMTYSKNPNYEGYDQRHPQNRVPYADTLRLLCIPDISTTLAALRTGKIDILTGLGWEQAESIKRTDPELKQIKVPSGGVAVDLRCDTAPFTDIKVRTALQMAIDRETIAMTHYGGTVDGIPCGIVNPVLRGYAFAYEDWPQELKDEYSFNQERARELLEEAGYPEGFKTNIVASSTEDLELLQIIKSYFLDIGVDMKIKVMESAARHAFVSAGQHDQMVYGGCGFDTIPTLINHRFSKNTATNFTYNNDPEYDEIHAKFWAATDPAEIAQLMTEADRCSLEKHWAVKLFPTATFSVWQPYLKGFSGETRLGWGAGYIWARFWVDQDLKQTMGR